jgi:hypothetical protein
LGALSSAAEYCSTVGRETYLAQINYIAEVISAERKSEMNKFDTALYKELKVNMYENEEAFYADIVVLCRLKGYEPPNKQDAYWWWKDEIDSSHNLKAGDYVTIELLEVPQQQVSEKYTAKSLCKVLKKSYENKPKLQVLVLNPISNNALGILYVYPNRLTKAKLSEEHLKELEEATHEALTAQNRLTNIMLAIQDSE